MHNKVHRPTEETRNRVLEMSVLGLTHEQIGALIGISDVTLRKHYPDDLQMGKAQASARIADTLFNKAQGGDTTAMIWWTKAQMRWSETVKQELTGQDGAPLLSGIQVSFVKNDAEA